MILDFHFPPNTSRPYSNGQRISFSSFGLYKVITPGQESILPSKEGQVTMKINSSL